MMDDKKLVKKYKDAVSMGKFVQAADIASDLASYYRERKLLEKCLEYRLRERDCNEKAKNEEGLLLTLKELAIIQTDLHKYEDSLKTCKEMLGLSKKNNDLVNEERSYKMLSYTSLEKFTENLDKRLLTKCEQYNKKCQVLYEKINDNLVSSSELALMKGRMHMNLNIIYIFSEEVEKSEYHFKKAARYLISDDDSRYSLYQLTAWYLLACDNYEEYHMKQTNCCKMALEILRRKTSEFVFVKTIMAKGYILMRNFSSAEATLRDAYDENSNDMKLVMLLKSVIRIQKENRKILNEDENLHQSYEIIADLVLNFADTSWEYKPFNLLSIAYYRDSIESAEREQVNRAKLSILHYSIAQCYESQHVEMYEEALCEYRKAYELEEGNLLEQAKTMSRIVSCMELMNEDTDTVTQAFNQYVSLANKSGNIAQIANALLEFQRYLTEKCDVDNLKKVREQLEELEKDKGLSLADLASLTASQESNSGETDWLEGIDIEKVESREKRIMNQFSKDNKGQYPLHIYVKEEGAEHKIRSAIQRGHGLELKDSCGWTPLGDAMETGYLKYIKILVQEGGAKVDSLQPGGNTPLMLASRKAADEDFCDVVEYLLDRGADPTLMNNRGYHALSFLRACTKEATERRVVQRLGALVRKMEDKFQFLGKPVDKLFANLNQFDRELYDEGSSQDDDRGQKLDKKSDFESLKKAMEEKRFRKEMKALDSTQPEQPVFRNVSRSTNSSFSSSSATQSKPAPKLASQSKPRMDHNSQRKSGTDFTSQRKPGVDYNYQRKSGVDFNNQRKSGIDFNSDRKSRLDTNPHRKSGMDFNSQRKSGMDFNSQKKSGMDFNSQKKSGMDFNSQKKSGMDFNSQKKSGMDFNSQSKSGSGSSFQSKPGLGPSSGLKSGLSTGIKPGTSQTLKPSKSWQAGTRPLSCSTPSRSMKESSERSSKSLMDFDYSDPIACSTQKSTAPTSSFSRRQRSPSPISPVPGRSFSPPSRSEPALSDRFFKQQKLNFKKSQHSDSTTKEKRNVDQKSSTQKQSGDSFRDSSPFSDELPDLPEISLANEKPKESRREERDFANEYANVMLKTRNFSRKTDSLPELPELVRSSPSESPELLSEDDWLEDDLGEMMKEKQNRKRNRSPRSPTKLSRNYKKRRESTHGDGSSTSTSGSKSCELSSSDTMVPEVRNTTISNETTLTSFNLENEDPNKFGLGSKSAQANSQFDGSQKRILGKPPSTKKERDDLFEKEAMEEILSLNKPKIVRTVKVKILEKTLLIPVAENFTVGDLSSEAAKRYARAFDSKPELTLSTDDGAELDPCDRLLDLLSSQDSVLLATPVSWTTLPPHTKYKEFCDKEKVTFFKNIFNHLERAEETQSLRVCQPLKPPTVSTLLRSIQGYSSLQVLELPNCKLGRDPGPYHLHQVLSTIESLHTLDLSNNQLTSSALEKCAPMPQNLSKLSLANNMLQSLNLKVLGSVLSTCPGLTCLDLSEISLSRAMLRPNQDFSQFEQAISGLTDLKIAGNPLEAQGLEVLLKLCPTGLERLDISSTIPEFDAASLRGVVKFCSQGKPDLDLEHLIVRNCKLSDSNLPDLLALMFNLGKLKSLDLSENNLTGSSLAALLDRLCECEVFLTNLYLENCQAVIQTGGEEFCGKMVDYMKIGKNLKHLIFPDKVSKITEKIRQSFQEIWKDAAKFQAKGEDSLECIV